MDRLQEARIFLNSFRKKSTQEFLFPFLLENYSDAIQTYYPGEKLSPEHIHEKTRTLLNSVFSDLEKINPDELFSWFHQKSRNHSPRDPIWFPEFMEAYAHYKHKQKLANRYQTLKPFLKGSTYCDVGCGGGDLVAHLLSMHPEFESAAGIDILDWRSPEVKERIDFQMLDFTKQGVSSRASYDTLTCLAVLHHTGTSAESMVNFLCNVKTAMRPGSVLIIEEDVILPSDEYESHHEVLIQIEQLKKEQPFLEGFLALSSEEQRDIIISIDFLANCLSVGVPEMPFPCGFQSLEQWLEIFNTTGLKVREVRIQGFVKNNFNQSSHVFFILENS